MCRLGYAMREAAHLQDKSEETINRTEDCETRQSSQGLSDNSVKKFSVITFISLEKKTVLSISSMAWRTLSLVLFTCTSHNGCQMFWSCSGPQLKISLCMSNSWVSILLSILEGPGAGMFWLSTFATCCSLILVLLEKFALHDPWYDMIHFKGKYRLYKEVGILFTSSSLLSNM